MWKNVEILQNEIVAMRRDLHKIPEIGKQLPQTQAYVCDALDRYGISYRKNEGDTGVIATINGGKPGKVICLRADMDALPIVEETGLPFASVNGSMHACGHDAHTAMLLAAGKVLQDHADELCGTVRLIFQTSEESSGGAAVAIENGAVEGADAVFGTHIGTLFGPEYPAGTLLVPGGSFMASFDKFVITVIGAGCHGSTPEKGVDPVNAAAHIVLALQTINSREFNACQPVVLTVGSIHGGSQYNIIPDCVVIEGTVRTLDAQVRSKTLQRISDISAGTAAAFGANATTEIFYGSPPVVNDKVMADVAAKAARPVLGDDFVITELDAPNMGGEDFAYYLKKVPGTFMFFSSSNPEKGTTVPHHNTRFDVDEDVLWKGAAVFVSIAEKFLNG